MQQGGQAVQEQDPGDARFAGSAQSAEDHPADRPAPPATANLSRNCFAAKTIDRLAECLAQTTKRIDSTPTTATDGPGAATERPHDRAAESGHAVDHAPATVSSVNPLTKATGLLFVPAAEHLAGPPDATR